MKLPVVYALERNTKQIKKINSNVLIKQLNSNIYANSPVFEFITEANEYIKPYADLDIKRIHYKGKAKEKIINTDFDMQYENREKLMNEAKEALIKGLNLPETAEIAISQACKNENGDTDKISYHYIVSDHQVFRQDLIDFVSVNKELFDKHYLDVGVYGKTQKFRMIKSSKTGQNRPLEPVTFTDDLTKHFITNINDNIKVHKIPVSIKEKKKVQKKQKQKEIIDTVEFIQPNLKETSHLINLLSSKRADDRNQWLAVGFCLYSINNNIHFLNLWKEFSKKSPKYIKNECARIWKNMKAGNYSIGSLHYWAKQDSPKEYGRLVNKTLFTLIEKSLSLTDADIADLAYEIFKSEWVYCDDLWFHFNGVKWIKDKKGSRMSKSFKELVRVYLRHRDYVNNKMLDEDIKDDEMKLYENKVKLITGAISIIKTTKHMNAIKEQLRGLLIDDNFINNQNRNIYLIGFDDGVYDLEIGCFRPSLPEDNITLSTKHRYSDIEAVTKEDIDEFMRIFNQIFMGEDENKYMLDLHATCLNGNSPQMFQLNWGLGGGNGKGFMSQSTLQALGDYAITFNVGLITQKRGKTGQASPEMASLAGVRYANCTEPEPTAKFNSAIIKNLTGGDSHQARRLNENLFEFIPQFTLFCECNKAPSFDSDDGGVRRRTRVKKWYSSFVDNEDLVDENNRVFKVNKNFTTPDYKLKFARTWLKILLKRHDELYKQNKHLEVKPTADMIKTTNTYMSETNDFISWMTDNLERSDDKNESLSLQTLFSCWTASEEYKNLSKRARMKKKDCYEALCKSIFFKDFHCEKNKNIPKKHPTTRNSNTLSYWKFPDNELIELSEEYD